MPVTYNPADEAQVAQVRGETAELLAGLDQERCNLLLMAFNKAAVTIRATNSEAMWALSMLEAQVLAHAAYGPEQQWAAARLGEMLRIALPGAMMQAMEGKSPDA